MSEKIKGTGMCWADVAEAGPGTVVEVYVFDSQFGWGWERRQVVAVDWPEVTLLDGDREYTINACGDSRRKLRDPDDPLARAPGGGESKLPAEHPYAAREKIRVQERLLIRGNTLAGVVAAALFIIRDGGEIPSYLLAGLERDLKSWAADVRAVASEDAP